MSAILFETGSIQPAGYLESPVTHSRRVLLTALRSTLKYAEDTCSLFDEQREKVRAAIQEIESDDATYLAISSDPELVSYAQSVRHRHDTDKRVQCTLERFLSRRFELGLTDGQLEWFSSMVFNSLLPFDYGFQLVSGPDLESAYRDGPRSCMSGTSAAKVRLWALNPEKVQLLTLTQRGKMTGRCLIWGGEYYDRVYCCSHIGRQRFQTYFDRMDWRATSTAKLHFRLRDTDNELYPYADSFCYASKNRDGGVTVRNHTDRNYDCILNSTDGHWSCMVCDMCGDGVHEDECSYVDGYGHVCQCCLESDFVWCESIGEHIHNDSARIDIHDEVVHENDVITDCSECERAITESSEYVELRHVDGGYRDVCENCLGDVSTITCPCCDEVFEV